MRNQDFLIGLAALPLMGTSVMAAEHSDGKCKPLRAQIVAAPFVDGCASPVGLCTAGTIDGNQGLNGTTSFTADSIMAGPDSAPDAPATISYSGVLRITTAKGTLSARDTGVFDTASGTSTSGFFASFDRIDGGTGRYAGATGSLFIGGKTVEGQFVSEVTGGICLP